MGEQLGCGWEPLQKALAKAKRINLPGPAFLLRDPENLSRADAGSWTGPGRGSDQVWEGKSSILHKTIKVQPGGFYF